MSTQPRHRTPHTEGDTTWRHATDFDQLRATGYWPDWAKAAAPRRRKMTEWILDQARLTDAASSNRTGTGDHGRRDLNRAPSDYVGVDEDPAAARTTGDAAGDRGRIEGKAQATGSAMIRRTPSWARRAHDAGQDGDPRRGSLILSPAALRDPRTGADPRRSRRGDEGRDPRRHVQVHPSQRPPAHGRRMAPSARRSRIRGRAHPHGGDGPAQAQPAARRRRRRRDGPDRRQHDQAPRGAQTRSRHAQRFIEHDDALARSASCPSARRRRRCRRDRRGRCVAAANAAGPGQHRPPPAPAEIEFLDDGQKAELPADPRR